MIDAITIPDEAVLERVRKRAWETAHENGKEPDLWCTDIPVCLDCNSANMTAYGGGKQTYGQYEDLVVEECHECETETLQVL